jgi:hypothetical protein
LELEEIRRVVQDDARYSDYLTKCQVKTPVYSSALSKSHQVVDEIMAGIER